MVVDIFARNYTDLPLTVIFIFLLFIKNSLTKFTDILRQRTKEPEVKKYCVSLLEKFGSFAYTKQVLNQLEKDAQEEISKLGGNPFMESFLTSLSKI